MVVLVPLTFDRFVSVVLTLQYKRIVNPFTAKIMVALTWVPLLVLICYDSITYVTGTTLVRHTDRLYDILTDYMTY